MLISAQNIAAEYGGREIFYGVSFSLQRGEILYVCGRNGSGKSTLMKILAGVKEPSEGEYEISDELQVCAYAAPFFMLQGRLRVRELMRMCGFTGVERERFTGYLDRFNLTRHAGSFVSELSSGMTQKLKLSLIASRSADLFIFDEPFVYLDDDSVTLATEVLHECLYRATLVVSAGSEKKIIGTGEVLNLDSHTASVYM